MLLEAQGRLVRYEEVMTRESWQMTITFEDCRAGRVAVELHPDRRAWCHERVQGGSRAARGARDLIARVGFVAPRIRE